MCIAVISRSSTMANTTDGRSHNQPSHEASVKGGEHSHSGKTASTSSHEEDGRKHNQPSHEAQVKGGEHSHSGSTKS
jgi:hypothetical protein